MKRHFILHSFFIALCLGISVFCNGCSDEGNPANPGGGNEHEALTTMAITLARLDDMGKPVETMLVTVRDTSVLKGKPPLEGSFQLKVGSRYEGTIKILNESGATAVDLTSEIIEEKDEHMFVLTPAGGLNEAQLQLLNRSLDSKGKAFGQSFEIRALASGTGNFNVALRHYDSGNKDSQEFEEDINRNIPVEILP